MSKKNDTIIQFLVYLCQKYDYVAVFESEKQKKDIENLLDIEMIDIQYIQDWCHRLNLKTGS